MKTVIVVPTYNEKDNIETLVLRIFSFVPETAVVVADDNSPDGTAAAVLALREKYPHLSLLSQPDKNGLGRAYVNAFHKVLADPEVETVVMMDADLSHDPKYLPLIIEKSASYGVVTGSRYVASGGTTGWEFWRRALSRGGNHYSRLITGLPPHDCTAGYNAINANLLRQIDLSQIEMSGYAFQIELKFLLHKAGATFYEVPIIFANRTKGESKMSGRIVQEGILAPWKMRFKKTTQT